MGNNNKVGFKGKVGQSIGKQLATFLLAVVAFYHPLSYYHIFMGYSKNFVPQRQTSTMEHIVKQVRRKSRNHFTACNNKIQPTWKCGLETHFANCLNRGVMTFWNSAGSITSRISSNSFRNITSFGLCTFGQNLSRIIMT